MKRSQCHRHQGSVANISFSGRVVTLGHPSDLGVTSQSDLIRAVLSGIKGLGVFDPQLDTTERKTHGAAH